MRYVPIGARIKIVREESWCTDREAIITRTPTYRNDFYRADCGGTTALLTENEFEVLEPSYVILTAFATPQFKAHLKNV